MTEQPNAPAYDERLVALRVRDQRRCKCGHACVSHGSSAAGVGLGECGYDQACSCSTFNESEAS